MGTSVTEWERKGKLLLHMVMHGHAWTFTVVHAHALVTYQSYHIRSVDPSEKKRREVDRGKKEENKEEVNAHTHTHIQI